MEDIPHPPDHPFEVGDVVKVQMPEADSDTGIDGRVCKVVETHEDDLNETTERSTDAMSYRLKPLEGSKPIPVWVRHFDLVPVGDCDTEDG